MPEANGHVDLRDFVRVDDDAAPIVDPVERNEVRVIARRFPGPYVRFAINLLLGQEGLKKTNTIKITGMGVAVSTVVSVVELLKQEYNGELHQITRTWTKEIPVKYEARDQQKNDVTIDRFVSMIAIELSTNRLDPKCPGYQSPGCRTEVHPVKRYGWNTRQNQSRPTAPKYNQDRHHNYNDDRRRNYNPDRRHNYNNNYRGYSREEPRNSYNKDKFTQRRDVRNYRSNRDNDSDYDRSDRPAHRGSRPNRGRY